jgi:hypothetical protein
LRRNWSPIQNADGRKAIGVLRSVIAAQLAKHADLAQNPPMSVQQIKEEITVLSAKEQDEVTAFLFHLRHRADPEYLTATSGRMNDQDRSHWLTPDEFERQLDQR